MLVGGAPASVETVRVLIIDDNPRDADLEIRALKRSGIAADVRVATRERDYRAALEDVVPDVILSDFAFPDFDGIEAVRIAAELAPGTPVIFVSGTISEERAVIAVRNGAVDYVLKSNLKRLGDAVTRAIAEARERTRRQDAEHALVRVRRVRDVLSAVNSAIVRIDEPAALFHEACRIANLIGGFPVAMVLTIDSEAGTGQLHAHIDNFPHEIADRIIAAIASDPEHAPGPFARSLREKRPVVVNDLERSAADMIAPQPLLALGVHSVGSFPFIIDRAFVGSLYLGATEHDYFNREEIELVSALTHNLSFALELASKRKRVEYLSYYDPLTELPNRTLANERLRQEVATAARRGDRLALVVFNIAQLASINTTVGEWAGDQVLRTVAQRLSERVDPSLLGRIAGDQFSMLIVEQDSLRSVRDELSGDGLTILGDPVMIGERALKVTAHVGCARYPEDATDADALFRNAQAALQSARGTGSPYRFYAPAVNARFAHRLDLEARLHRAAVENAFVLHYQPKVDVSTRGIVGVEALIRWRDPARPGVLVSPAEFVPILEETGLIVDVGRWALGEAVRQRRAWLDAGLTAPRIAVNVSAVQLQSDRFVGDVEDALALHPGEPGLDVEVTESGLMGNVTEAIGMLRRVRDLGVEIAIDDFGTGYSSLSYVFQLPISTMKIDRSFIDGMTDHANKMTIVSTMISLGRELKLCVIAEGVETEEQARLLRLLRCDQMQGYLIARPLPSEELTALLKRR